MRAPAARPPPGPEYCPPAPSWGTKGSHQPAVSAGKEDRASILMAPLAPGRYSLDDLLSRTGVVASPGGQLRGPARAPAPGLRWGPKQPGMRAPAARPPPGPEYCPPAPSWGTKGSHQPAVSAGKEDHAGIAVTPLAPGQTTAVAAAKVPGRYELEDVLWRTGVGASPGGRPRGPARAPAPGLSWGPEQPGVGAPPVRPPPGPEYGPPVPSWGTRGGQQPSVSAGEEDHAKILMTFLAPRRYSLDDLIERESAKACAMAPGPGPHPRPEHGLAAPSWGTSGGQQPAVSAGEEDHAGVPMTPLAPGQTTVVVKNLPGRYTLEDVLRLWPVDHTFDFMHAPYHRLHRRPMGFVFINFLTHELALAFQRRWHGTMIPPGGPLEVYASDVQGRRRSLQMLKTSRIGVLESEGFLPCVLEGTARLNAKAIMLEKARARKGRSTLRRALRSRPAGATPPGPPTRRLGSTPRPPRAAWAS